MLFEVFSHSFFNHEAEMSAAEMIAQFHFYLLGNPEGLAFDCPDEDYATSIWKPLTRHVERHGGRIRTGEPVTGLHRDPDGWQVHSTHDTYRAGHVVLAVDPPALAALVAGSPSLVEQAPALAAAMPAYGRPGPPYAVARYWCDGDVDPDRAIFSGVSRQATLDSVTLYHRLERESRHWAERAGGSVIELHAYACEPDVPATELAERMRAELAVLWPETAACGYANCGPGSRRSARLHAGQPRLASGGPHRRHRPLPGRRRHRHRLSQRPDGTGGGHRHPRGEPHPARRGWCRRAAALDPAAWSARPTLTSRDGAQG